MGLIGLFGESLLSSSPARSNGSWEDIVNGYCTEKDPTLVYDCERCQVVVGHEDGDLTEIGVGPYDGGLCGCVAPQGVTRICTDERRYRDLPQQVPVTIGDEH